MAKYVIDSSTLTDIADAIRTQYGENTRIAVSDMAEAILGIEGGGGGDVNVSEIELEKLGYSVPPECPMQNEVEGNVFIKKVGRVHLGDLTWTETTIAGRFYASAPVDAKAVQSGGILNYCEDDKDIAFNDSDYSSNARIYLTDSTYANNVSGLSASLDGVYCFYELKETILLLINDVENLFVPNVPTTSQQGMTFTFNEADNSYTLNGTSTANIYFEITGDYDIELGGTYKLIGVKTDSGVSIYDANNVNGWAPSSEGNVYDIINEPQIYLYIAKGTTLKNVIVRPVITTDFDVTYDDIVPSLSGGPSILADWIVGEFAVVSDTNEAQIIDFSELQGKSVNSVRAFLHIANAPISGAAYSVLGFQNFAGNGLIVFNYKGDYSPATQGSNCPYILDLTTNKLTFGPCSGSYRFRAGYTYQYIIVPFYN